MHRPTSLSEALEVLADHPDALVLAGGTDVMVDVNLRHVRPETVVSVRRVPELLEHDERFIGAGVSYSRLESSAHEGLAEAARTVGSPQIRAWGTIGGNLGTASPAGDTLPFLVAAEAVVVLGSRDATRRLPVADFLVGPKQNALAPGELIIGVEIPDDVPRSQAFSKVGVRQSMVIAMVNSCVLRSDEGTTRVAIGAVGSTVLRARGAEALAGSATPDDLQLDEFQRLVSDAAEPISDHRGTAAYRRYAVGVIARRALERILAG